MSEPPVNGRFRFAGHEFDARTGELCREGVRIPLRPQAATVLAVLVDRAGELVTRDELQQALWADTVVDAEAGLNHCVRQVRLALGENASEPRFLQTEPRRGYRFTEAVERVQPASLRSSRGRRLGIAASLGLAAVLLATPWLITGEANVPERSPAASSDEYRRARWLLDQPGAGPASRAVPLLHTVVEQHPDFAPGHAALARAIAFASADADLARVRRHADAALRLDAGSAEALVMRGFVRTFGDRDYADAERDLREAARLAPDSVEARHHLASLLSLRGEDDEALRVMHEALQRDPVSPLLAGDLAWFYFVAGRWSEAVHWADRTLALDPDWDTARSVRLHATVRLGHRERVRALALESLAADDAPTDVLTAVSEAVDPMRVYWRWWAERLGTDDGDSVTRAMVHAGLGDSTRALAELTAATGSRRLHMMIRDPRLESLAATPEFDRLRSRLGLQPGGADSD